MSVFEGFTSTPKLPINGRSPEEEAARLHFRKNRPDRPEGDMEFPPYRYMPFPTCMYRENTEGEVESIQVGIRDLEDDGTVNDAKRERNEWLVREKLDQGWCRLPSETKRARLDYERRTIAIPAAERAYDDRKLGEKAREELHAIEDASGDHVVDVEAARKDTQPARERARQK